MARLFDTAYESRPNGDEGTVFASAVVRVMSVVPNPKWRRMTIVAGYDCVGWVGMIFADANLRRLKLAAAQFTRMRVVEATTESQMDQQQEGGQLRQR